MPLSHPPFHIFSLSYLSFPLFPPTISPLSAFFLTHSFPHFYSLTPLSHPTFSPFNPFSPFSSLTLLSSHFHSIIFTLSPNALYPLSLPPSLPIFYTLSTDFIAHLITFPFSHATLSSLSLLSQPIFMHHFLSLRTLLSLSPHTSFFSFSPNFSLHSHTTDWP